MNILKINTFSYDNIIVDLRSNVKLTKGSYEEFDYKKLKFTAISFKQIPIVDSRRRYRCKFYDADMNLLKIIVISHVEFISIIPNVSWCKFYRFANGYMNYSKRLIEDKKA